MYSQGYIDGFGEKYLYNILIKKELDRIDASKNNLCDKRLYYVFQHFLVKCYIGGIYRNECAIFLSKIYNDLLVKPYDYVDSPLLKNSVLDEIFKNNSDGNRIKTVRNKYFDANIVRQLYIKSRSQELTDDEKNRLYSFLIKKLNSKDSTYDQIIKKLITNIISSNKNVKEFNDVELKFYCQYVSNFVVGNKDIQTVCMIGKENSTTNGNQLSDMIVLNKYGFNQNIAIFTKTICHETRHSFQEHESLSSNTKAGFELAQMHLFSKYLNTKDYDSYHKNYRYSSIELDAEKSGHWNASVFFTMFNRKDLAEAIRENRIEKFDKRNYYSYMIDTTGKAVSVEKYIVLYMDEIIKKNPSELEKYTVLKQIYNSDGTRKNFGKLFYDRMNQDFDNRGVYDNYIDYGIAKGELEKINLTNARTSDINKFFKTLSYIYRDKMLVLKDYYDDNPNISDNHVSVTTGYQIDQLYRILNYVNDNYEMIIKNMDEKISNRSFVFDFIYDLRDFNLEQIKNEKIKNNPQLISKIQLLQSLTNIVIGKFNYHYLVSRMSSLTEQELNSIISFDGNQNIKFKDYLINIVLPNMDSHQEIINGDKKIYVGDIINSYKNGMKINENNDCYK